MASAGEPENNKGRKDTGAPAERHSHVPDDRATRSPDDRRFRLSADLLAGQQRLLDELRDLYQRLSGAEARAEALMQDTEAAARRLHALHCITEVALSELPLGELLPRLLDSIKSALGGDTAAILLVTDDGQHLVLSAASGIEKEIKKPALIPIGRGIAGRIAAQRQPMVFEDISQEEVFTHLLRERVKSLVGAPLLDGGRVIGVVYVGTGHPQQFAQEDIDLLQIVAERAAFFIDRARADEIQKRLLASEKEARAEAEAERARFQTILESAPYGILFLDASTGRLLANPAAVRLLGREPDPSLGLAQLVGVLHWPDGRPVSMRSLPMKEAASGKTVRNREFLITRPDGTQIPIMASASPVCDAHGNLMGSVVLYQDITAQKELERLREEWTSIVAHDMRQPIAIIQGYSQLMRQLAERRPVSERELRLIEHIHVAAANLSRIVDDLLDISRLEARELKLDKRVVDLVPLVKEVVERMRPVTTDHPVDVRARGDGHLVCVDPARMEQVLGNILSNAAKYGYPATPIEVEIRRQGEVVRVSVTNQGKGIPRRELSRLFTRFHRTAQARAGAVSGIGLGLYITRGIVEAHGGRIWVDSTPGERTTFTFTLPLAQSASAAA